MISQIDFGEIVNVSRIVTKGSEVLNMWPKSVVLLHSENGLWWEYYDNDLLTVQSEVSGMCLKFHDWKFSILQDDNY